MQRKQANMRLLPLPQLDLYLISTVPMCGKRVHLCALSPCSGMFGRWCPQLQGGKVHEYTYSTHRDKDDESVMANGGGGLMPTVPL